MSHADEIRAKHQAIVAKFGKKFASVTAKSVEVLEIGAGAAIAGVIQGREIAKGNVHGARLLGLPADLAIGVALEVAGHFDLAGPEWSHHLCNFGAGFIAGYASDWGNAFGKRWVSEGHLPLFERPAGGALPGAVAKGEVHPSQMAELLRERMSPQAG
jgi:hypothetical protein